MRPFFALLILACFAVAVRSAEAADYRVVQCANAPHDFVPFSQSLGMSVEDKCASIGALSVRANLHAIVAPQHNAMWLAWAPDGTTFSSWQASFQGGSNNNTGFLPYAMACADTHCAAPIEHLFFGLENWGNPIHRYWAGSGAQRLQFGLVCSFGASGGCGVPANPPGVDMFAPEMTLTDHHTPSAPVLATPLAGWRSVRHDNSITFGAHDRGSGVERVVATIPGGPSWTYTVPCARGNGAYMRLVPCPLITGGAIPINVGSLADGRHSLVLASADAAGQVAVGGPSTLLVDNTAPDAPTSVQVVGGEGWRTTDGFGARWTNPPQPHSPVVAAHWRLCTPAGSCRAGRVAAGGVNGVDNLAVGRSGEYALRVWLEDEAGNQDPGTAAAPVHLRLDNQAPRPLFEPRDPARPLRLAVTVSDDASGLASGGIEVHREGSDSWTAMPTTADGTRLTATIDDETLPDGRYEVRARAVDRAGNEATTDRTVDDARMVVQLPVRVMTRIRAGQRIVRARRVTVRRKGRRKVVERRVAQLDTTPTTRAGTAIPIDAVLESLDGTPLADVELDVLAARASGFEPVATARTDAAGRVRYRTQPTRNETLRLRYRGTAHVRGAFADVAVGVRASSTLRVSDRSVLNGESIILRGRIATGPVPARGKLVEVQAFFRDRWRTFSTVRSNRQGEWLLPYTFGGTVGTVQYRFRVRLPGEGGYPYEPGSSPVRLVTVRGL